LVSFGYIWIMRHWANEMLWFTIFLFIAAITATTGVFLNRGLTTSDTTETDTLAESESDNSETKAALGVGIALLIVDFLVICAACFLRKKIGLVGHMVEEAGLVLVDTPSLLLFPILPLMFAIGWFALWFYHTMLIVSAPTMDTNSDAEFEHGRRVGDMDDVTKFVLAYHVFAFLWVMAMFLAITKTTIAGVASTWYFTRDKDEVEGKSDQISMFVVGSCFVRTLCYNLGSLAFGTLLQVILLSIKLVLMMMTAAAEQSKKSDKTVFILKCLTCVVQCLEKIMEYLNKFAFIEIAMYGISYCDAVRRVGPLIMENLTNIAIIDTVGDFMLFLCKAAVSLTVGLIFYAILQSETFEDVSNPLVLTMVASVFAYLIASSFFGVMEATIDTILVCFCEDVKHNGPGKANDYYMSPTLKDFIEGNVNLMTKEKEATSPVPKK